MQNIINGKFFPANQEDSNSEIIVKYPYINKILLLLFCGYVIIWYLQIGYRIPILGTIRFEFIYAGLLTFSALFFTPKIDADCPLIPYIFLYFIAIVIQIPFSYDFDTSWDVFVDRIIKFAFMSFFIIAFVRSPRHLKFFIASFLLACFKMGQEGFTGRISGNLMWWNQGIMRLHGATPIYLHPNSFSGMALGVLPFIYYLWKISNKYIRAILFVMAIFSLNIILYTGSRTGYVGLCVFALYILYTNRRSFKTIIIMSVTASLLVLFIPRDYVGRFDTIITEKDESGHSIDMRKEILRDAWQIFIDHPLGIGVSAFPKMRMDTFGREQDTHNLYLQVATNLGVQGLGIFLLLIVKLLTMLNNILFSTRQMINSHAADIKSTLINDLKFIEAVANATIAFIVIRLTLGMFGMDLYEIYWWFAVGITTSLFSMLKLIDRSQNRGIAYD